MNAAKPARNDWRCLFPAGLVPVGYAALMRDYGLEVPAPRVLRAVDPQAAAGRREPDQSILGLEWDVLPRARLASVPDHALDQFPFALKHEGIDLRILWALFRVLPIDDLVGWIETAPYGEYQRRLWFLYEWLTGQILPLPDLTERNYIPIINERLQLALPQGQADRITRQRVFNNLPGVPGFCPLVRAEPRDAGTETPTLINACREVIDRADPALLRRATSWLLLEESRGSFAIEGEAPPRNRTERWGRAVAQASAFKLDRSALDQLHRELLGSESRFARFGYRRGGGFIGSHHRDDGSPQPAHISARPEDLSWLMDGLCAAYARMHARGYDPVAMAASIGFGFVFIHPFEDGNGRLHRFLIQKALMDAQVVPPGTVLPVSLAILDNLPAYRAVLETFSRPLLPWIDWEATENHNIRVLNDTGPLYPWFDATPQTRYLARVIDQAVRVYLVRELEFLVRYDDVKRDLDRVVEMPDRLLSLFLSFCLQNEGRLGRKRREEIFAELRDEEIARLEAVVAESGLVSLFSNAPDGLKARIGRGA